MHIDTWVIAVSALVVTVMLLASKDRKLKIFSITTASQFVMYAFFSLFETPVEVRAFAIRASLIMFYLVITTIILFHKGVGNGQ